LVKYKHVNIVNKIEPKTVVPIPKSLIVVVLIKVLLDYVFLETCGTHFGNHKFFNYEFKRKCPQWTDEYVANICNISQAKHGFCFTVHLLIRTNMCKS